MAPPGCKWVAGARRSSVATDRPGAFGENASRTKTRLIHEDRMYRSAQPHTNTGNGPRWAVPGFPRRKGGAERYGLGRIEFVRARRNEVLRYRRVSSDLKACTTTDEASRAQSPDPRR